MPFRTHKIDSMGYLYIWKCFLTCQELNEAKILKSGETQTTNLRDHIKVTLYPMTNGIIYPIERFDNKNNATS